MADQQHETKVEFRFNCDDPVSTLEMKKIVTSSDGYVQWEVSLGMVPYIHPTVKDHYEVTAEAAAFTTETPPSKKFVYAICKLLVKSNAQRCNSCNSCRSYGYQCTHLISQPEKEGPLSNSFVFKISDLVPTSGVIAVPQNRNGQYSSTTVVVTIRHFKSIEVTPELSPDGPCVIKNLKAMLDSGDLSDVTFLVGGTEVKAHSQILGAASDVFKAMFQHDTQDRRTGRITVQDVDASAFKEMLRCVYTDASPSWTGAQSADDFLMGLLFLSEKYNLESLRGRCQRRILCTMTVENSLERLIVLNIVCPTMVPLVADPFVRTNFTEILSSEAWGTFMKENVDLAADVMFYAMKR